jgi:hypothetical protein
MELLKTDLLRNALDAPLTVAALQRTVPRLDRLLLERPRAAR